MPDNERQFQLVRSRKMRRISSALTSVHKLNTTILVAKFRQM